MNGTPVNPADIDKALENLQAKAGVEETINLEKSMTVEKRAMGGATKNEEDPSTDKGRDPKKVKNPEVGRHPASKKSGNFAEQWKGAKGLENAAKEDGVHKNPLPNRGMSKAVDGSADSAKSPASASSSKKVEKAVDGSAGSAKSPASASSSKKMEKGCDASPASASPKKEMEKAVVPAEEASAASGSASGASKLADVKKAIGFISSAHKHLTKAFEDGSEKDLDKAGNRLLSAKKEILKALEGGVEVNPRVTEKLNKAADYFCKALETYEKEDQEGHVHAVNHARSNMEKAIDAGTVIEKSVEADSALRFVKKDGKMVLEMTEDQYKQVYKSLSKDNLYKSLENEIPEDTRKAIDAVPMIKDLFKSLTASNDSLRDAIVDSKEKDRDFKKSVTDTVSILGENLKKLAEDIDGLKGKPNPRKSVVTVIESPLAKSMESETGMDRNKISAILEKALDAKLIDIKTYLAWDVDKDMPETHEAYAGLCKSIEGRLSK
ncbi:MAG: hypothetical protein PHN89_05225 [Candidatus Pacebacteria bacterium]|nr:hypothetical protein [Candidatus Paceibacterota bacterium]